MDVGGRQHDERGVSVYHLRSQDGAPWFNTALCGKPRTLDEIVRWTVVHLDVFEKWVDPENRCPECYQKMIVNRLAEL